MNIEDRVAELVEIFNLDEREELLLILAFKYVQADTRMQTLEEYGKRLEEHIAKIEDYRPVSDPDRLHDYPESFLNEGR